MAAYANKRLKPEHRDLVLNAQKAIFREVKHEECAAIGDLASHRVTACQMAVRCVCKGQWQALGALVRSHQRWMRASFPPRTAMRRALKTGNIVFCFRSLVSERFWHANYINLNTFLCCLLNLVRCVESDEGFAAPIEVQATRPAKFLLPWDALEDIIVGLVGSISCQSFCLVSLPYERGPAFEVFKLRIRPLGAPTQIWPLEPAAAAGTLDAIEDYEELPLGCDGGVDEPLDAVVLELEEAIVFLDLPPAVVPAAVAPKAAAKAAPVAPKAAPAAPAIAAPKAAAAKAVPGAPRAAYDYEKVYHQTTGEEAGTIRIWLGENSLSAKCKKCGQRKNKRFIERQRVRNPSNFPQGRPMGSLLEWLHLPCTGLAVDHDSKWTEADLKWEERNKRRTHFKQLGCLDLQFGAERDPWGHELVDSEYGEPRPLP